MRRAFLAAAEDFSERGKNSGIAPLMHRSFSLPLAGHPGLSTELYLWSRASQPSPIRNVVVISSGVHGIEGYTGSALQSELLYRLDAQDLPEHVDLIFIHALNPWGMKNFERTDQDNIDINRNCHLDQNLYHQVNPELEVLTPLLSPQFPVDHDSLLNQCKFLFQIISIATRKGIGRTTKAILNGQYENPKGLFYGGEALTPHIDSIRLNLQSWAQLSKPQTKEHSLWSNCTVIDLHTGLGGQGELTLLLPKETINSEPPMNDIFSGFKLRGEPRSWPVKPGLFSEWVCQVLAPETSSLRIPIVFEIGTLASNPASRTLDSLNRMIRANQMKHNGCIENSSALKKLIRNKFEELFFPNDNRWQEVVLTKRLNDLVVLTKRCLGSISSS